MTPPEDRPLIVATDLDGTLLRSDGSVSERTRAALAAARAGGITVVFVTGRPPMFLTDMAQATGHTGTAICANGAIVLDLATLQPSTIAAFEAEGVPGLISDLASLPGRIEGRVMMLHPDLGEYRLMGLAEDLPARARQRVEQGWSVYKIVAVGDDTSDPDAFLAAARELLGPRVEATHSSYRSPVVELGPPGVTKGATLAAVAAGLGARPEDVHAVGDMPNDLPMLGWAGHSYAVANAHADVRRATDGLLPSHDDDGVADLIFRLLARFRAG